MDKEMMIGKVNIDLREYPGEDYYTEGEIEDRLLDICQKNEPKDFRKIVENSDEWSFLYHLSKERQNIVSWLPISKEHKVLEVGAGMGAITGELCKLAYKVDSIDLSLKRSKVNAYRNQSYDNLSIKVGNLSDIEPKLENDYDWIMLIGVFEYAISYIKTEDPFADFLKILRKHLASDGRIVIAIENRLGLKYFAGCREDHTCGFYDGIENYVNGGQVRTFSKKALEELFKKVNITDYNFYYPYPDYKLPNTIFSDKRLPKGGELRDNIRNFDQDRLLLFNETNAYDSLIEDGYFPDFSNSFEVIIGPLINVVYARYSMERDDELCIKTVIDKDNIVKKVVKSAVYESGKEHIADINKAFIELNNRYSESDLNINRILKYDEENSSIEFEYIEGSTLEELLDDCVKDNNKEGFLRLFEKYKTYVYHNEDYPVVNDDLIFSNIIIKDNEWYAIDYEWVRFTKGSGAEVVYRAINNYLIPGNFRLKIKEWIDTENDFNEDLFRERILNKNKAMSTIRHNIGKGVYSLDYMTQRISGLNIRVQVYEDFGDGFKEERSYYVSDIKKHGPNLLFKIPMKKGLKNLRVDPGDTPVRFYVNHICLNDIEITDEIIGRLKNGCVDVRYAIQKNNTFIFKRSDPHFKLPLKGLKFNEGDILTIDCRAEYIY